MLILRESSLRNGLGLVVVGMRLRVPLTLICADGDYTPVRRKHELAALVPGAQVVVISDSHHALPVENPAAFNAALRARLVGGAVAHGPPSGGAGEKLNG